MRILLPFLLLLPLVTIQAGDPEIPTQSEVMRTIGTATVDSPDFSVNATVGLTDNLAPTFSYDSSRTTGGLKYQFLSAKTGALRLSAAAEALYSSKEHMGGRVWLGAQLGRAYFYAAPGNFWDSGATVRLAGRLSGYASYGRWDQTIGLSARTSKLTSVHSGYSHTYGWVLGITQVFGLSR